MAESHPSFNVEIKSKQLITPSSPTLPHLRCLPFSLNDQVQPHFYVPIILFYPKNTGINDHLGILKSSLAQTLSHFYPLAGKIKDNFSIECDDHGVEFLEAQVNCPLSEFLQQQNLIEQQRKLIPIDAKNHNLMIVQVTLFECGGIAIATCFSHKIADALTFISFIKCWAAKASGKDANISPNFGLACSHFPPSQIEPNPKPKDQPNVAVKRVVFHGSKIAELKEKVASQSVPHPSRVEVVTALIWKSAMAASRAKSKSKKQYVMSHAINLRGRIKPQLSHNSMGNVMALCFTKEEGDIELPILVSKIRRNIEEFNEKCAHLQGGVEASEFLLESFRNVKAFSKDKDVEFYAFSSWCRFPLYEVDFGWGKPSWVSYVGQRIENWIFMRDTRDGNGIEAWMPLSEENMVLFERDEELLAYGTLDPVPDCL